MTIQRKQGVLQGVWDGLRLFPFSLSVGVCSGFGLAGGLATAAICGLCGIVFGAAFCPTYLALLPVFSLAFRFGAGSAGAALVLGGVFTFLWSLLPEKARARLCDPAVYAGLIPAAAFITTALQTTNYFGIGAVGGTVREIVADYISLGFHPNWRGVLYGTIALVLLITYPRKFKRLHKMISPAFATLLIVLPLNLFLVPVAVHTPINEIGSMDWHTFCDHVFLRGAFTPGMIPYVLCAALSIALLTAGSLPTGGARQLSAVHLLTGFLGGAPCETDGKPRSRSGALVCTAVAVGLYFVPGLARMPLHAAAVILIVTAWQSLPKDAIRAAFRTRRGILLFFCALLLPVLTDILYAVPLLAALGALIKNKSNKPQL